MNRPTCPWGAVSGYRKHADKCSRWIQFPNRITVRLDKCRNIKIPCRVTARVVRVCSVIRGADRGRMTLGINLEQRFGYPPQRSFSAGPKGKKGRLWVIAESLFQVDSQ